MAMEITNNYSGCAAQTGNGINGAYAQIGMNQAADSYSRNIQNQIADAQRQLQELSSNKDMTQEEKTAKRQELQQQKQSSFDDLIGGRQETDAADTGVIISLSTTKEQLAGMMKVRTDLQGKLRTA